MLTSQSSSPPAPLPDGTAELQVFLKDFLGVVLDEDKLMEIIESVNPDNMGLLTFRDFVTVWYQYCSDKDSKDKIIQMCVFSPTTSRLNPTSILPRPCAALPVPQAISCQGYQKCPCCSSRAFEYLDKDQSKTISVDEFTEAMTTVGDPLTLEECKLFYQLLDKGKAQELSESEFEGFMREHFQTSLPMEGSDGGGGVLHYLMRYLNNI